MLADALSLPTVEGVNVKLIVQFAAGATELLQVLVSAKSLPLVPVMVMLEMLSGALPVFESVTLCGALGVPTLWLPNDKLVRERLATGTSRSTETVFALRSLT